MSAVPFYDRLLTPPKKSNLCFEELCLNTICMSFGREICYSAACEPLFALHYVNHFTMSGLALENRRPNDGTTQRLQGYFRHR